MGSLPDIPTVNFTTGADMIDKIERELKNSWEYKKSPKRRREIAENRFLEHGRNLDCYMELFTLPYGDPRRVNLKRYNP